MPPTLDELKEQAKEKELSQPDPNKSEDIQKEKEEPKAPSIEQYQRIVQTQMAVIADYKKNLGDMRAEIDGLKQSQKPPAEKPKDADFFKEPTKVLDDHSKNILDEMKKIVEPLIQFKDRIQNEGELTRIKNKLKAENPNYARIIDHPQASAALDQALANQPVTEQNVRFALYGIQGAISFGDLPVEIKEEPKPKVDDKMLPPHLRSSAPSPPKGKSDKPKKDYTENERRLMRELRISEDDWEDYGGGSDGGDSHQISTFQIEGFKTRAELEKEAKK